MRYSTARHALLWALILLWAGSNGSPAEAAPGGNGKGNGNVACLSLSDGVKRTGYVIRGTEGSDTIDCRGVGRKLTIYGLGGSDWIIGGTADDVIDGGDDNDTLMGGPGADSLIGGNGADWVLSEGVTGPVIANLDTGATNDGYGDIDTYTSVENLEGGPFNDQLTGGAGPNTLRGWEGDDILDGAAGSDSCNGHSGADSFISCETISDVDTPLEPDLVVRSITPLTPEPGSEPPNVRWMSTVTVGNDGWAPVVWHIGAIGAYSDDTILGFPPDVGGCALGGGDVTLGIGESHTATMYCDREPPTTGYLLVAVDWLDSIRERNETNNVGAIPLS